MPMRLVRRYPLSRFLLVSLLTLGLARTPMPRADFHNVRHHHGAGEVCELHDHLLRWHPDAGDAEDVAVLHWHWLTPSLGSEDSGQLGVDLPRIHAHVDDGAAVVPDDVPQFVASQPQGTLLDAPQPLAWSAPDACLPDGSRVDRRLRAGPHLDSGSPHRPLAQHVSLTCWFARWVC